MSKQKLQRWKPKKQGRRQNKAAREAELEEARRLAAEREMERQQEEARLAAEREAERQLNSKKQKKSAKQKLMHKRNLRLWKHRWHPRKQKRNSKSV